MKKTILILFILLSLFVIPNVNAAELPREGVTYFMTYPNNEEVATEDYDEAISEPERLIFEGTTDANGQVIIHGLNNQGEIRISSNGLEETVNLSNQRSAEIKTSITNTLLNNPKTGSTLIFLIIIISGLIVITIKTNKKKQLLVIPLLVAVLFSNVQAENDDFTVTVKNSLGQALTGTQVKVYAKPIKVEGLPAIKYDANGGKFIDGSTIIYEKIPYNECSWEDAMDYWNNNDREHIDYIGGIIDHAYREGYYPIFPSGLDILSNGQVFKFEWEPNSNAKLVTINGNGKVFNIFGKELNSITFYREYFPSDIITEKLQDDEFAALSTDSSCNALAYGLDINYQLTVLNDHNNLYLCTNNKADGIYMNGNANIGNKDSCFLESNFSTGTFCADRYCKSTYIGASGLGEYSEYSDSITRYEILGFDNDNLQIKYPSLNDNSDYEQYPRLISIEIVYQGETIVSISSDELTYNSIDHYYTISNISKNNIVKNYINSYYEREENGECIDYCDLYTCEIVY